MSKKATFWTTTTFGMRGYFAVLMWDGEEFEEPYNSGFGSYKTRAGAEREAKDWAAAENIEYRP